MLALEEVGSSLTRVKKWGDGLVGGATMHTTALYLKTNSFTNSIVFLLSSSSSSSISPSASQAQLAKSTAGAIFRLCGRGSKKLGHGGPKIGLVVWRGQVEILVFRKPSPKIDLDFLKSTSPAATYCKFKHKPASLPEIIYLSCQQIQLQKV